MAQHGSEVITHCNNTQISASDIDNVTLTLTLTCVSDSVTDYFITYHTLTWQMITVRPWVLAVLAVVSEDWERPTKDPVPQPSKDGAVPVTLPGCL